MKTTTIERPFLLILLKKENFKNALRFIFLYKCPDCLAHGRPKTQADRPWDGRVTLTSGAPVTRAVHCSLFLFL